MSNLRILLYAYGYSLIKENLKFTLKKILKIQLTILNRHRLCLDIQMLMTAFYD